MNMTHENFEKLFSEAVVHHGKAIDTEAREKEVRMQWDPEKSFRVEQLPYQSIQIGISGEAGKKWFEEWIDSIEDVTEKARGLKKAVDDKDVGLEELISRGLMPRETEYKVSDRLRDKLQMDVQYEKR